LFASPLPGLANQFLPSHHAANFQQVPISDFPANLKKGPETMNFSRNSERPSLAQKKRAEYASLIEDHFKCIEIIFRNRCFQSEQLENFMVEFYDLAATAGAVFQENFAPPPER